MSHLTDPTRKIITVNDRVRQQQQSSEAERRLSELARVPGRSTIQAPPAPHWGTPTATTSGVANRLHIIEMQVTAPGTVTGVIYRNGTTINSGVKVGLWDYTGQQLLGSSANVNQAGASQQQLIPFSAVAGVPAGVYWAGILFGSGTTGYFDSVTPVRTKAQTEGSYTIPTTITPPTAFEANTSRALLALY